MHHDVPQSVIDECLSMYSGVNTKAKIENLVEIVSHAYIKGQEHCLSLICDKFEED